MQDALSAANLCDIRVIITRTPIHTDPPILLSHPSKVHPISTHAHQELERVTGPQVVPRFPGIVAGPAAVHLDCLGRAGRVAAVCGLKGADGPADSWGTVVEHSA